MSDNQRHVRELANPRYYDVDSATVIEIGDNVWLDTNDVKPASDFTWNASLAQTQADFKAKYVGMSADRSRAGDTSEVGVDKNGIKKFTCASATFEIGDLVGPAKASGNALENQKVVAVASEDYAIGRVAKRYASATTEVEVDIRTFLDDFSTAGAFMKAVDDSDDITEGATKLLMTVAERAKLTNSNALKLFATEYEAVAGDDTAGYKDIDTGFAQSPNVVICEIRRAGVDVKEDAILTKLGGGDAGKIRIADGGATYALTAGDIISLIAVDI